MKKSLKMIGTIMALVFGAAILGGCADRADISQIEIIDVKYEDSRVKMSIEGEEKGVLIDACVSWPDSTDNLKSFSAKVSQNHYNRFADDWIFAHYDSVETGGNDKTFVLDKEGNLIIGLSMDATGIASFVDAEKNISGHLSGNAFLYNSFVGTPENCRDITEQQAIEGVEQSLSYYSDFTFRTYRTLFEETESGRQQFRVFVQPVYNEIPICIKSNIGSIGTGVSICDRGISSVTGLVFLDEIRENKQVACISLETAISCLAAGIDDYLASDSGEIYQISLEYFGEYRSGTYSFNPVWVFYGHSGEYYWMIGLNAYDGMFCFSETM